MFYDQETIECIEYWSHFGYTIRLERDGTIWFNYYLDRWNYVGVCSTTI